MPGSTVDEAFLRKIEQYKTRVGPKLRAIREEQGAIKCATHRACCAACTENLHVVWRSRTCTLGEELSGQRKCFCRIVFARLQVNHTSRRRSIRSLCREYYGAEHLDRLEAFAEARRVEAPSKGPYCNRVHPPNCLECRTCHFCRCGQAALHAADALRLSSILRQSEVANTTNCTNNLFLQIPAGRRLWTSRHDVAARSTNARLAAPAVVSGVYMASFRFAA